MKIGLYIGSWAPNIGNAFFDYGLKAVLMKAFPNADFYPTGGAVHWFFRQSANKLENKSLKKLFFNKSKVSYNNNSLEIGEIAELDFLAFAGMSACEDFVNINGKTIINAAKNGTKILGIGVGMSSYSEQEADIFSNFLNSLGKYAIITRDNDTYLKLCNRVDNIESGIDCAFFLPDYYKPPKINLPPYDIENFDSEEISDKIQHNVNHIIYTHHSFWDDLYTKRHFEMEKTLISDIPEDYLTLYSQVNETHSDRVHACVATLAYGNKAKLYSETPRKSLFEKLNIDITNKVSQIDNELLERLKQEQIEKVKYLVNNLN
jgi:hypothetical protein